MSHVFAILASEGGPKTLWDPTIIGVLVVVSGLVLFCGSAYLLLATNVGARLGFMVSATALSGIMVLLSSLWLTTQTPLNSPKGRTPLWSTIPCSEEKPDCAVVDNLADAPVKELSDLARGNPTPIEAEQYQTLRSAVDTALLLKKAEGEAEGEVPEQPYAKYETGGQVLTQAPVDAADIPNKFGTETLKEYIIGGDTEMLVKHKTKYAAVEFCEKQLQPTDAGFDPRFPKGNPNVKPTTPGCDPTKAHQWILLRYDYGSIRLPAFMYLLFSTMLFAVSLYALHSRELAQRRIAAANRIGGTSMRKAALNLLSASKRSLAAAGVVWLILVGVASPAGALAPQPIDASEQGPLAFVAMTVMIVIFVFTLFYMDRIRKRADERDQQQ